MVGGIKAEKASFDTSPPTLNSMTALCFILYILRCHGDTVHSANFRTSHSTSLEAPEAGTTGQTMSQNSRDKQSADQNIKQISIYATTVLALRRGHATTHRARTSFASLRQPGLCVNRHWYDKASTYAWICCKVFDIFIRPFYAPLGERQVEIFALWDGFA